MATSTGATPIGPYTPAVRAGDWIIVSGQLGLRDGAIVAGGVKAQTAQAIVNLKAHLASMGATIADVKKTMCFLTDLDTFATFNESYVEGFGTSRPARSTVQVSALPAGGAVEIEAWAYKPERATSTSARTAPNAGRKKAVSKKAVAKKAASKKSVSKKSGSKTSRTSSSRRAGR
jgi:2-iminobutanoate/2-iminopropanoate deaminase